MAFWKMVRICIGTGITEAKFLLIPLFIMNKYFYQDAMRVNLLNKGQISTNRQF